MNTSDSELRNLLAFEGEKRLCERIMLACFAAALFLGAFAFVFERDVRKAVLVSAMLVGGVGLKVFSFWYLLYGGCLTVLEKLKLC